MASFDIEQISAIIKDQVKKYGKKIDFEETGEVISLGDDIAIVSGIQNCVLNEIVILEGNNYGLALSLEPEYVGVILLNKTNNIKEGSKVTRTKVVIEVPTGDHLLGRVVNSLGQSVDEGNKIEKENLMPIEKIAPGIMIRSSVNQPLETGILAIDSMIPIGKGQRELIIGDRETGKTAIAIDAILNQKNKDIYCVYVSIGQKNSTTSQIVEKLREKGALKYTTVVVANAADSASMQYLAPYTGITIAESWMEKGKDVLIIYDDLSKHAIAYRTLSLLLRRPPGREAYPGDVFYLHSRLLERSAKLDEAHGGGSITALPIVETQAGDISAYIPTNVISITDGQIFLKADEFNSNQRPAIDSGESVSRVGFAASTKAIKKMSKSLKLDLANYQELKSFSQFGSDLDETTKNILSHGEKVKILLRQKQYEPLNQVDQVILLYVIKEKELLKKIKAENISRFKSSIISYFKKDLKAKNLRDKIDLSKDVNEEDEKSLKLITTKFTKMFLENNIILESKNG